MFFKENERGSRVYKCKKTILWNTYFKILSRFLRIGIAKKKCVKSEFLLFYTTNLQKCWAKNFFWVDFFPIISTDLKFGVIEYIYEYLLEQVECKFARNGLTIWKTFIANLFENII